MVMDSRVCFNFIKAALEIHISSTDDRRLCIEFGATVEDGEHDEGQVCRHEIGSVPFASEEHGPSAELNMKITVQLDVWSGEGRKNLQSK
jgi:hypothetical protein